MLNQVGKDVSSVKAIVAKCEEMFSDAEGYESISLHTAVLNTKEAVNNLNKAFEENGSDTIKIGLLKQAVDRNAIVLEYHLQVVCSKYRDIYMKRVLVEEFSTQVVDKMKAIQNERSDSDIILWSSYSRFVLNLKRRALRLIFNLYTEDLEMIEQIKKGL